MAEIGLREAAALVHRSPRQIQRLLRERKLTARKVWIQAEGQELWQIDVDSLQAHYAPKSVTAPPAPLSLAQELAQLRKEVEQLRADLGAKHWMGR